MELENKKESAFQKFIKIESLSGIVLLFSAIFALIWANSPFAESYSALWNYKIGIKTDNFELEHTLLHWINDGFMAVFFFLIGLEIKREFLIGGLNTTKKLAFPLIGAIGGMVIPVLFFIVLNGDHPGTSHGWGIPMATDIAFSLAIMNALGKKVPLSLKVFLTAFAIVDDLGAVIVIALFYSGTIKVTLLAIALLLLAVLYFISYKNLYTTTVMIFVGIIIWVLFLESGIHPTLAGILLAFSVPIGQKIKTHEFTDRLLKVYNKIKGGSELKEPILSDDQIHAVDELEQWTHKYQSPLQHFEHQLHNWVAFFIIPVFALANSGVSLNTSGELNIALAITIAVSLLLGKSIGVTSFVLLAKKLKIITVPDEITLRQIIGTGFLAGIGFTMAIFIAGLAFKGYTNPDLNSDQIQAKINLLIDSAKIGILVGSSISGIVGYIILNKKPKQEVLEENSAK